ncbi:MAG: BamA/TamA family outer membrane protein [Candidatus Adiutrix sp.]|jgi:translocation and assembly module TamA|nr:BamA/TamA family outer membrane protein [Candidatus Adiutrix sp.]
MFVRFTAVLSLTLALCGCGVFGPEGRPEGPASVAGGSAPPTGGNLAYLHANIPAPKLPPELAGSARAANTVVAADRRLYRYSIDCQSPEVPELAERFEKTSRLSQFDKEPEMLATLEQRLAVSLDEGRALLHSRGYYDGYVEGRLNIEADKVAAVIRFSPGKQYTLGRAAVIPAEPLASEAGATAPPASLEDVGLAKGSPAVADDILNAVNLAEAAFRNRGYPRARVENTRYTVDRTQKTLEAEVLVQPGSFARMGQVEPSGEITVDRTYLNAQQTWKSGAPWNQELLDNYLAALRQTGLFQSVEGYAAREDGPDGLRPVVIRAVGGPERTVGGMVSYDTDFGPGLTGYWEHRNLTGHGDRLRLDLPLWGDLQEFAADYRYPFFARPDQDLIARGGILHEDSDAYELWSGAFAAGLERRLSRRWTVSALGSVEGGSLEDPDEPQKEFLMFGLAASAAYDSSNNLLDPSRGGRLMLLAAPYTGTFHDSFNVVRSRVEGRYFLPLGSERLVLATRGVWGSLWGADNSREVPSTLRFYSGGGGSVRGYDYQSVGPRNNKNEPLGGVSQVEVGTEARWRFAETMGLVAFIDGGMVYENVDEEIFQDLLWGAGLGFRYYTAIGPVRADVAVPLDKRPGDSSWQLYISIGQSF